MPHMSACWGWVHKIHRCVCVEQITACSPEVISSLPSFFSAFSSALCLQPNVFFFSFSCFFYVQLILPNLSSSPFFPVSFLDAPDFVSVGNRWVVFFQLGGTLVSAAGAGTDPCVCRNLPLRQLISLVLDLLHFCIMKGQIIALVLSGSDGVCLGTVFRITSCNKQPSAEAFFSISGLFLEWKAH